MENRNKRKHGFEKIERAIIYKPRDKKIDESFWRYKAMRHWSEAIVGYFEEAKELTQAIDLKNGTLVIACLSKELARKIKIFAEKILQSLNELLGRRVIYALVVEE